MTKKLTPSHIAVAVAAGLTAQTALAQTPQAPQPTGGSGQEITPMIKLDNNQYSGQGFFEKPSSTKKAVAPVAPAAPKVEEKVAKPVVDNAPSVAVAPVPSANAPATPVAAPVANKTPIKDPMLPLDIVGSKDAKENTKGGLTPPLAKKDTPAAPVAAASGLKKPDALLVPPVAPVASAPSVAAAKPVPVASAPVAVKAPVVAASPAPVAAASNPVAAVKPQVINGVPPAAIPMVVTPTASAAPVVTPPTVGVKAPAATPAEKVAADKTLDKTETLVKPAPVVVAKKKAPVAKKTVVAKKPVVEAPFNTLAKQAVPVEVKELPSAGAPVAPALYAAEPTTPIIVTEVVRIDSISLQAPTMAEQETQPLPRLPQPEPIVAAIVPAPLPAPVVSIAPVASPAPAPFVAPTVVASAPIPAPAAPTAVPFVPAPFVPAPIAQAPVPMAQPVAPSSGRVDVPMASASMDDLPSLTAPSVDTIRNNSRLHPRTPAARPPVVVAQAPVAQTAPPAPVAQTTKPFVPAPAVQAPAYVAPPVAAPVRSAPQENRDARIQSLLDELKTLQSNPIVVQSVQPPVEVVAPHHVAVPKIDPAATIQLPLPEEPRPLIKPTPKEPARMVTEHAPKAAVDVPQTAAIDAPRTMSPAPTAPVLEPRTHRVANPKFVGLPEKGDFIAFMPGSSHVSEETVESLRSMVDVFKQHGIRKIVLTGTALRDEDTEDMESSDFAQKRAKNLKAAFQRAGFKGVIALDDPKRARPGTTPRVGLVALQ